ncbi:DeoR/GlpR transcriptional regulator [bacterium]|nr:DeoR/GlpR transcriptional regulator [bacterium]
MDEKDLTIERRSKIIEQINREGQVQVLVLSKIFRVSPVTIRNDLSHLEQKNLLIRTRGGAIRPQQVAIDYKLNLKAKKHFPEKQSIGKNAAKLINEGETIILDSGTTTMEIAKNLNNFKDLTVITNALNIARQLAEYPSIRVIIPGGILRKNALSMVGPMAESTIQNYFCDKLFLGVDGIDIKYGISTPNVEEAYLNKIMIKISKKSFVVADSSKFTKRSFALIAPLSDINTVITDKHVPQEEKDALENLGIDVIIA